VIFNAGFLLIVLEPDVKKLDLFIIRLEGVSSQLTEIKVGDEDLDLVIFCLRAVGRNKNFVALVCIVFCLLNVSFDALRQSDEKLSWGLHEART